MAAPEDVSPNCTSATMLLSSATRPHVRHVPSTTSGRGQALLGHCWRAGAATEPARLAEEAALDCWAAAWRRSSRSRMARMGLGRAKRGLATAPAWALRLGLRRDDMAGGQAPRRGEKRLVTAGNGASCKCAERLAMDDG